MSPCAEHEAIVEAIRAHDPVRARAAMTRHLAHVVTALSEGIVSQGLQGSLAASHVAFAGAD